MPLGGFSLVHSCLALWPTVPEQILSLLSPPADWWKVTSEFGCPVFEIMVFGVYVADSFFSTKSLTITNEEEPVFCFG